MTPDLSRSMDQPPELDAPTSAPNLNFPQLAPLTIRIATLAVVIVPFLGLIAAIVILWGWGFSGIHAGVMAGMYLLTAVGVTVGYHRLFTHKSFQTYPAVTWLLAILGSMAVEGPVLKWVAQHRRHHQHSDHEDDPHSPHLHGAGFGGMVRGLWHAHVGWVFGKDSPNLRRYVADLTSDPVLGVISNLWMLWALLGLLIPTLLGGLLTLSWSGALIGFIWGGLARLFLVHHVTWSVNSICHIWGRQPFRSHDQSRNNVVVGVLALGEGWHNNHHAFPTSARHGLYWWQIDLSYYLILFMQCIGLAWDIRTPSVEKMAEKAM